MIACFLLSSQCQCLILNLSPIMATKQFIGESPYVNNKQRSHPQTDFKYQEYSDNVTAANSGSATAPAPPVKLAIFGLGRAGKEFTIKEGFL